jgi:DNA-binding FadR family transcriptional regulator
MPRESTVAAKVLEHMRHLQLRDQARLPPERELAATLGVTRAQLRTGLSKLKADGKLWGAVGKGTFAGRQPPIDPDVALRLSAVSNPHDVMEARLALEPMLASLAAVRASPLQIALLDKCVRQGREARDRASFQRSDEVFHRTIAEAAGNRLLLALFTAVMECRRKEVWGNLRQRILTNERRETYNAHHAACLAAIRDRRADRAAAAMRQHLELVSSVCDVLGAGSRAQGA